MGRLWRVIGGERGGLLVREGRELTSNEKDQRLSSQSIVEELEVAGGRLHYSLLRGEGPSRGWISMKLKEKPLLASADTRETGKHFEDAPIPELLVVQASERHGTARDIRMSLDELEQSALREVKKAEAKAEATVADVAVLERAIQDMLYIAWRRENRKRVVLFLAKLLQLCSKCDQLAARTICHHLCLVSWASSMVDVEFYALPTPSTSASPAPLVLLCGFGGSHLDDLQTAILRWTKKGCGVLAFTPARVGREDMLDLLHSKLVSLHGHPVIIHLFSDGGFCMARSLLGMWDTSWQAGQAQQAPADAVKCIICDGAGLLPHEAIRIEGMGSVEEPVMPSRKDFEKEHNQTAMAFFTGCGLNMLMSFGACEAFHQDPANSFGRTLVQTANANLLGPELTSAPRGPLSSIWQLLRKVLLIASKGDKVVPLERTRLLEAWLRSLPRTGQDERKVELLVLEKAMHCRGMLSHSEEYWEVVDRFIAE